MKVGGTISLSALKCVQNKDIFLKIINKYEEEVESNIQNIINNIGLSKEEKQLIS